MLLHCGKIVHTPVIYFAIVISWLWRVELRQGHVAWAIEEGAYENEDEIDVIHSLKDRVIASAEAIGYHHTICV